MYQFHHYLLFGLLVGWIVISHSPESELACFHVSGPAYTILRTSNTDLNLEEIDQQILKTLSTLGPIDSIIDCAASHGVKLFKHGSTFEEMVTRPMPFLAVIKRPNLETEVHEFILVDSIRDGSFLVYEFRTQRGWVTYNPETFQRLYAGILLSRLEPARSQISFVNVIQIILIGIWGVVIAFAFVKRGTHYSALTLLPIALIFGCSKGIHSDNNLLVLNPEIYLGNISQNESVPVIFRLKTGDSDFLLREISTSN
jgi:hypothetical protein